MMDFRELCCCYCGKHLCWCDEPYVGTEVYCKRCKLAEEKELSVE